MIIEQINEYISEISSINYKLDVKFEEDPERYQDVMVVEFTIADFEVFAIIR